MSKSSRSLSIALALCGLTAFGCGGSPGATTASNDGNEDLSDSALALRSDDTDATFEAMSRCKRGRHGDADGGVDESGHAGGPRRGRPGVERGLDQLLAVADLDALAKCQTIAKECEASADHAACGKQVIDCIRPVLEGAFKALCESRSADCAQSTDDPACKRAERTCSEQGGMTKGPAGGPQGQGHGPGDRRGAGGAPHR